MILNRETEFGIRAEDTRNGVAKAALFAIAGGSAFWVLVWLAYLNWPVLVRWLAP